MNTIMALQCSKRARIMFREYDFGHKYGAAVEYTLPGGKVIRRAAKVFKRPSQQPSHDMRMLLLGRIAGGLKRKLKRYR